MAEKISTPSALSKEERALLVVALQVYCMSVERAEKAERNVEVKEIRAREAVAVRALIDKCMSRELSL